MQAGHQVFLLPPYFRNLGKRLIKAPKLYFSDTALAAYLMGIRDEETLLNGPSAGALFETSVVSACLKRFLHRGETPPIYYWRSRDGLEVDLLIEKNQKLYPIEVKSTATVRPAHAAAIEKWRTLAGRIGQTGLLVTQTRAPLPVSAGVHAVPWSMI
jgi:predicted AAA+ superfamily ATPase